jgi:hypothetical protein
MSSQFGLPRSVRRIMASGAMLATGLGVLIGFGPLATQSASAATTATSSAVAPCTARTDLNPFTQWGDHADYFLVPNGNFADGSTDWGLSGGASVVNGGEPFGVMAGDSHSLAIPSGAQAVSETMCVTVGEEDIRMLVKNPGVKGSTLHVAAYVNNPLTGLTLSTAFDIESSSLPTGWGPAQTENIPNLLSEVDLVPSLLGGILTQNLTLVFSTQGTPATWNIDDVFVDPFKST